MSIEPTTQHDALIAQTRSSRFGELLAPEHVDALENKISPNSLQKLSIESAALLKSLAIIPLTHPQAAVTLRDDGEDVMVRTITRIVRGAAIEAGHAIQLDLEIDGNPESLRCETHSAPALAQAVHQSSAAAELLRKVQSHQPTQIEVPYHATNCNTGSTSDGNLVAIRFSTEQVVPVYLTMTPTLARQTIARLQAELDQLGRRSPIQKN